MLLYDMGLLSFVGSLGCFVTQYMIFALAIFLDQRRIFPKWLAYMSVWGVVTEFIAATIWTSRSGRLLAHGGLPYGFSSSRCST